MNLAQRRLIMNAFIFSQFGKLNNCINNIHERALRISQVTQNKSASIHQTNLQILATEIFKAKNGLNHSNHGGCFQIQKFNL